MSPCSIRITENLRSDLRFKEYATDAAVELLGVKRNLYELTNNDVDIPDKPHARKGLNRPYGDIDMVVSTRETMEFYDGIMLKGLHACFQASGQPYSLMTASGYSAEKQGYKVSWRFTCPSLAGTKQVIQALVCEVIEPRLNACLSDLGMPEYVPLDASVYNNSRKMRMLNSSKDGENRPLRLVHGEAVDTLITHVPEGTTVLFDSVAPKKQQQASKPVKPASAHAAAAQDSDIGTGEAVEHVANIANGALTTWEQWYLTLQTIFNVLGDAGHAAALQWSRKSPKHDEAAFAREWAGLKRRDAGFVRTVGSLCWLSKQSNPAAYLEIRCRYLVDELFSEALRPAQSQSYDARYVQPLPIAAYDTITLSAALGTGKTVEIMRILQEHSFPRVLFISGRKSFTSYAMGELARNGLPFHSYEQGGDLAKQARLFIQVESLHRLHDGLSKYDLVILDESETICHQLHSVQTNRAQMINNHVVFQHVSAVPAS